MFWNRVDNLWNGKSLKELARLSRVDYVLFLNWRTKHRLPDLVSSCHLANALDTTVEHLVLGNPTKTTDSEFEDIIHKLHTAAADDISLIRRVLRIPDPVEPSRKQA